MNRGAECGTDHKLLLPKTEFLWIKNQQNSEKKKNDTKKVVQFKLELLNEESLRELY